MCSSQVSSRLAAIFLALAAPYILLSVSYEVLFLMTLTVTLHQWLQVEVGQLTWASQSLTQVSSVWCNHSNQGDIDCDLAPVATDGGRTADLGLTVHYTGLFCILGFKVCYMCLHLMP